MVAPGRLSAAPAELLGLVLAGPLVARFTMKC
jgi:hypothetical protein